MSFFEFPHTRTYDSDLGWLIRHTHTNEEAIKVLEEWKNTTDDVIDDLKNLYEAIISGDLPPAMVDAIEIWLRDNAGDIIPDLIKAVFFGLENGYFVAYIPDSWADLIFGTSGLDDFPAGIDFGHLTLSY